MRGIASIEISSDYEEISNDAPSSTDNSDNEGVNHEANGDSDNADNESSNDNSPALNIVRHPNYNVVNVPNNDVDANNAEHDSENEEDEGARSDSQRLEYDWNYAEQDSISDSDDYDWNFGYEEDQAGATNSGQNTNITTQTTNAEKDDKGGPSNSENQDSASANPNPENADKNDFKSGKPDEPDEPGDPADASSQSRKPDDLAEMEDDNLKLFHSLELDETKNEQTEGMSSASNPSSDDMGTENEQTTSDENKISNDAADTSEMTFGSTGYDCGRGAIRRTGQSSNRDRDIFTPTTRTTIRKSNQNAYRRSPFENSDEYSMRGYQSIQQDFNYADYINVCASSFTESDPVESDNFSGYRSPNLSRYGNLNSPGFGDSGEHSYETERLAVHEAPANPEHGTIQTPAYSTSGTGNSGGDNQTSVSSSSPVSPSHGIQHTSSEFNTPGYDGPGWSDHRAPYSSLYEGPRSHIYAAPEISSYSTETPEYSSSRSPRYAAVGSSGFFGSSTYNISDSSRYGVPGLTGYDPSRSSNYEVPASAQYGVPAYSTYGPSPSSSWTSSSPVTEYGTVAPSGYCAPISASYGAPALFDYRTSNSYGYGTQCAPIYDASAYYGYSGDYSSFGYCNIGSSGYSASMSPGYDVSGSAGFCPSVVSTYSTTRSSRCSAHDYGTPESPQRAGSTVPSSSFSRNPDSLDYGMSNLSVCVPVPSHYGPSAFSGFGASHSTGHGISRASKYGAPCMAGSCPSGIGLGLQAKIDEILKSGDKANKNDSNRVLLEVSDTPPFSFDFRLGQAADTEYRGYGIIEEITAHLNEEARRSPVPGPGYGRGRAAGRGRSAIFGPLQDIGNTQAQRGPRRPLIEVIGGTDFEVEIEPNRRGRGRGRGRRGTNGN